MIIFTAEVPVIRVILLVAVRLSCIGISISFSDATILDCSGPSSVLSLGAVKLIGGHLRRKAMQMIHKTTIRSSWTVVGLSVLTFIASFSCAATNKAVEPPPNAPAVVDWNEEEGRLRLWYHGSIIFDAIVKAENASGRRLSGLGIKLQRTDRLGEKVEQVLKFSVTPPQDAAKLILRGTVFGSEQAFPAETFSEAQKRFPYVRNSVGLSRNLRNNAVYDRRWDWLLSGPGDGQTRIVPQRSEDGRTTFSWISQGSTNLQIVFRPHYYQKHKGYKYFMPWTYNVWTNSVTGYCTWWAYRRNFTQKTLDALLDVFVKKHLPDFGYTYIQLDDCYQIGNGSCPQNWLNWNPNKFPGGWKCTIKAIRQAHMKPGIWVHRVHRPSDPHVVDIAREHPDWFVHKADGSLFVSRGFYVLDMTNEEAIENMARKLFRELAKQGWSYVKIDGAGDLLYACMSKECEHYFQTHSITPEEVLRKWDEVAREELGTNTYILTCHSVRPGSCSIGLVDGCRLSNDGFQPRTLAQYNSIGGVLWRNDPDHCDVLGTYLMDPEAMMPVFGLKEPVPARSIVRPAFCTMAGAVLMVSDKVEVYQDDRNIEGMKRCAPVLFTVPGQLYDVGRKKMTWWLLEIDRPFDHWSVLARFQWAQKLPNGELKMVGLPPQEVKFADIGLNPNTDYLVFEFWSQKYIGKFRGAFIAPAMDANTALHVFAIRQARPHPWVLSTTRHLTQGGVSLLDEKWDETRGVLSGRSAVVQEDPYVLTIYVPPGYHLKRAVVEGYTPTVKETPPLLSVGIIPRKTETFHWEFHFQKF